MLMNAVFFRKEEKGKKLEKRGKRENGNKGKGE